MSMRSSRLAASSSATIELRSRSMGGSGPEVRPGLRQPDPAWAATRRRQMALGRGRREDLDVQRWLWRAVDQDGFVFDVLVQSRRDKQARQAPAQEVAEEAVPAASSYDHRQAGELRGGEDESMPSVAHRQHKGLNNRTENSHQPARRRERQMKRFKSSGQAMVPLHA